MKDITWKDLGFLCMSEFDGQRRFFRIDREPSVSLNPRYTLAWIHQPSKTRHSKQHRLRTQTGIRSIAEAKELAAQWAAENMAAAKPTLREIELLGQIAVLECDVGAERQHADRWQQLAGRYDDIRYELRNCPDTPEGHAKFYNECARLIFGDNHD